MIQDGSGKSQLGDSLIHLEGDHPNSSSALERGDIRNNFMETETEMEDKGYSDFCRNSTEEIFLKSLMENSIGMPAPTMEMLGFKNLSQSFRVDSEELFNTWLTNGENNGHNSTNRAHRTRQASRRLSTELAALTSHQHGVAFHNKSSNDVLFTQNLPMVDELSSDQNQHTLRNTMEKGMQATNMYIAKAWFQSSQPMTRSRSSELRRRYAATQNFQTSIGMEATRGASGHDINRMKQAFATSTNFCDASMVDNPNQLETFMSPSNSSTSPFSTPVPTVDAVSSVVSMLKGTLERKKLSNHIEGSSFEFYGSQEVPLDMSYNHGPTNHNFEASGTFQPVSPVQVKDSETLQTVNEPIEIDIDGLLTPANPMQITTVSREPSQSESSAAAPVLSTGFEVCDGPSISGQTPSVSENSRKQVGNGSLEYSSKAKEFRERIIENNLRDDRKKGSLVRVGSVTSGGSVDKGDPTKKRRVERSRKMAEAKERNMTPAVSLDMQSVLKRCENLEKEVRSLKLNLSFMNRSFSSTRTVFLDFFAHSVAFLPIVVTIEVMETSSVLAWVEHMVSSLQTSNTGSPYGQRDGGDNLYSCWWSGSNHACEHGFDSSHLLILRCHKSRNACRRTRNRLSK